MAELNMIQGTKTVAGDIVSFETPRNVNIKSLKVNFLPQQAGSGNASPDNVREIFGWNDIEVSHTKKNIAHIVGFSAQNVNNPTSNRLLTNIFGTTISTTEFSEPDTKLVITQTAYGDQNDPSNYNNGYFIVVDDNLKYGVRYNVSFRITDVVGNLNNNKLTNIAVLGPGGGRQGGIVVGDRIIFKNVLYKRYSDNTSNNSYNRHGIEIRNCGMSFTLSEFMVTPVSDTNYDWVPYYDTNLFDVNSPISYGVYNTTSKIFENNNTRITTDYIPVKYGNTYTESIDPNGTENLVFVNYSLFDKNYNILGLRAENGDVAHNGCSTHRITINVEGAAYIRLSIRHTVSATDLSSTTLDNAQLRFEDGSYVTNNEWTAISLQTNGKNMLDIRNCVFASGYINGASSDGFIGGLSGTYTYTHNYIPCRHLVGKTITLNHGPGATNPGIAFYDNNYIGILAVKNNGVAAGDPMTVEVPQDAYYFRFTTRPEYLNDLQIEIGSEATEYEPFDNTMYGGSVDLITGEVIKTHEQFVLDGSKEFLCQSNGLYCIIKLNDMQSGYHFAENGALCDKAVLVNVRDDVGKNVLAIKIGNGATRRAYIYNMNNAYEITNLQDMQEWLNDNPITFTYPLETPELVATLSPMELKTFVNTNNIWSNASSVEVEYEYINEFNAIESRKIILNNTPHLETAAGKIAEFGTDIAAPLKDCKIHFGPVQNLNGFDNPFLAGHNKNLLDINSSKMIVNVGSPTITQNTIKSGNAVVGFIVPCSPNTTYTYSWRGTIYGPNLKQRVYEYEELPTTMEYDYMTVEQATNNSGTLLYPYKSVTFTTKSTTNYLIVGYINNTGLSINLYEMMLERGSTRTEYEPYTSEDNVCPIYPRNFVNIYRAGDNALDLTSSTYYTEFHANSELEWIKVRDDDGNVIGVRVNGTTVTTNNFHNLNAQADGKLSMAGGEYYSAGQNSMFNNRVYGRNTATDSFGGSIFNSTTVPRYFTIPEGQDYNYVRIQLLTTVGVKYSNAVCYPRMYPQDTFANNTITFTEAQGENIYDYTEYPLTTNKWVSGKDGEASSGSYYKSTIDYIPCEDYRGMTMTLNFNPGGTNPGIAFYNSSKTYISGIKNNDTPRGNILSTTVPDTASYYRFTVPDDCRPEDVQIEVGEPINAYAGYVDLINGELVVTAKMYTFDGSETWGSGGLYAAGYRYYSQPGTAGSTPDIMYGQNRFDVVACNWLTPAPNGQSASAGYGTNIVTVAGLARQLYVAVDFCTTVDEWKAYLSSHPLQVVCNLATPIHYKVAAYTPSTIQGVNNMWSDEYNNTTVEATYWKHDDDSIRRLAGTAYESTDDYAFITSDGFMIGEEADYIEY